MKTGFIRRQIAKSNALYAVSLAIALGAVAFVAQESLTRIYNLFFGPFAIEATEVLAIPELDPIDDYAGKPEVQVYMESNPLVNTHYRARGRFWFSLTGSALRETSLKYIVDFEDDVKKQPEARSGGPVAIAVYRILAVGGRDLLVKAQADSLPGLRWRGLFVPMAAKLKGETVADAYKDGGSERLLPFLFDATGSFRANIMPYLFFLSIFSAIWLFLAARLLRRAMVPATHPSYRSLWKHGNEHDLVPSIEAEIEDRETLRPTTGRIVTRTWVIRITAFRLYYERRTPRPDHGSKSSA